MKPLVIKKRLPRSFPGLLEATLVICLFLPPPLLGGERRIELKKIFEFTPKPWRDWPGAILSAKGDRIFYYSGPNLQVVDVRTGRVVAKADYSYLPCPGLELHAWPWFLPGSKELRNLVLVPGTGQILGIYCGSLLLIDEDTLQIIKQLARQPEERVGGVVVLADGLRAAITLHGDSDPEKYHIRLTFFDIPSWTETGESWPVPVDAGGPTFSDDGNFMVLDRTIRLSDTLGRCGLEVREVPSGRLYAEWWPSKLWSSPGGSGFIVRDRGCPRQARFVPGKKVLVAAAFGESIVIWDLEKRQVVNELQAGRPVNHFLISPDGSLLIATFINDPEIPPDYKQDFIAWDLDSGLVAFESPKKQWSLFEKFFEPFLKRDLVLSDFSQDGRYLLVRRYKRLIIYEVVRPSDPGNRAH